MDDPSVTNGRHSPGDRLDSWKEIAAFLGRGIRTVQRWEREEGLPVHRLVHDKRGSVYARREELSSWWETRRLTLAPPATAGDAPVGPRLERVTRTSGVTSWPALSSDAQLIAYVSDGGQDGTPPQIWIQQRGGAALQLTTGDRPYSNLSFSPDNTRIIFSATDSAGPNVYEIPALGGEPRLLQRAASSGRLSPDGQWLVHVPIGAPGIRIAARDGLGFRTLASTLMDVIGAVWLPDGRSVLVQARSDSAREPDWWMVPVDGTPASNTSIIRKLRETGFMVLPVGFAWVNDGVVFTAAGRDGINLYRQRVVTTQPEAGVAPERLTTGDDAVFASATGNRVVYVSAGADLNLWSIALDPISGTAQGHPRRLTRGAGPVACLSLTNDFATLAYSSVRRDGMGEVFLRDLATGSERVFAEGLSGGNWYSAISPSGRQLAFGMRAAQAEVRRPIFIASLADGAIRTLGEDCGGRPCQWADERLLILERFGRLNSVALIDADTGTQSDLLESADRSIKNARLSPDGRWIAFDAAAPAGPISVLVAPFRHEPVPESEWVVVDRQASHPFWSADGRLLYYTRAGSNPFTRSAVVARHFAPATGLADGEPMAVYASQEMMMPAYLSGAAPVATPDQIILVLGDFRGDVWLMDL